MYIRCRSCEVSTWIPSGPGAQPPLSCRSCGQRYGVAADTLEASAGREHTQTPALAQAPAQAKAQDLDLDLAPSAAPRVRRTATGNRVRDVEPPRPAARQNNGRRAAEKIGADATSVTHPRTRPVHRAVAGALFCIVLAGIGWMSWSRWQTIVAETQAVAPLTTASPVSPPAPEPATPFELALSAAQVDRTEDGAILLIRAPTPETALAAYCAAAATAMACQPLEIVQLRPPHPDGRVGLLRNFNDLSRSGAVHIRLDRATRRWTIGDGAQEIVRVDGTLYESAPPKISTAGYQ